MSGDNPVELVASINRTLLYLMAAGARDGFRAIVSDDGTGHYATIGAAVTAGEKFIWVKNGSYAETTDITLIGVTIIGQSTQGVKITLTDATFIMQDNKGSSIAGTARPTNNDKSIVGAGTAFTVVQGDTNKYIFADRWLAEIDTVGDATNMELLAGYFGATTDQDGANYTLAHQTFSNDSVGSSIQNLTILHVLTGANNCIELQGIRNSIKEVQFINTNNSSTFIALPRTGTEIAVYTTIEKCRFGGGAVGLKVFSGKYTTIKECDFFGCNDNAIELTSGALGTAIVRCGITGSTRGINFSGAAQVTTIQDCWFAYTALEAIIFARGGAVLHLDIVRCAFKECYPTSRTMYLDGSNVNVEACTFERGTIHIYVEDANDVSICNCTFNDWETRAIDFNVADTQRRFVISHNHFIAESAGTNTESGLDLWGEHHLVTDNVFENIEEEAVDFQCHRSVLSCNTFKNCGISNILAIGDYNNITNNTIEDSTDAIVVTGDECVISGNIIKDDLATALLVSTGDRNIITTNRVENPVTNGIQVNINSDRDVITNNICLNAGGVNLVNNGTNSSVGNNIVA